MLLREVEYSTNTRSSKQGTVTAILSTEEVRPIAIVEDNLFKEAPERKLDFYDRVDDGYIRGLGERIASQLNSFGRIDDVYSKAFADTVLVVHTGASDVETAKVASLDSSSLGPNVFHFASNASVASLPPGPYFLRGSNIYQAWRLYPDELDAFIFGVVPQDVLNPQVFVGQVQTLLSTNSQPDSMP